MSEMKDSGLKYIGLIPNEWNLSKIKFEIQNLYSGGTPESGNSEFYDENGENWIAIGDMSNTELVTKTESHITKAGIKNKNLKLVRKGTILYSIYATIGKVSKMGIDAYINQAILAIYPRKRLCNDYLKYTLMFLENYALSECSNSIQNNLNALKVKNFPILQLDFREQELIAKYLDNEIIKLDKILERLKEQIEILNKYKESIINESLTKNIFKCIYASNNNNYTLEGWRKGRIKNVISVLTDYTANGSFQDLANNVEYLDYESFARLVRLTDLREKLQNSGIYVNEDSYRYLKKSSLYGDEVLVANVGAYAGLFCIMPKINMPATLGPNMYLLKTNSLMLNKFLYYLGNAKYVSEQLIMKATSSAQPKLNKEDVKTIRILIPPIKEQQEIVDYLDKKCEEIDSLINMKQEQIEKMKQYKKSLIYEYVTGKKRVKGAEELYG